MTELLTKPQRNCNFKRFETEIFIDWTCPTLFSAKSFIEGSLYRYFGSRKKLNFKTGASKCFTSQVVDGINSKPTPCVFYGINSFCKIIFYQYRIHPSEPVLVYVVDKVLEIVIH